MDGDICEIKNTDILSQKTYTFYLNAEIADRGDFRYSLSGKNKIPLFGKLEFPGDTFYDEVYATDGDLYIQNKTVSGHKKITAKKIVTGSGVKKDEPSGDVNVENAELDVECEEIILMPGTTIDENTKLNIKFQQ